MSQQGKLDEMQLEVLDAGTHGWRLNVMHARVKEQSWKASGMSDHGLQGGEHWEEAKMARSLDLPPPVD